MRWLVSLALLAFLLPALSWAQASPSSLTAASPGASPSSSRDRSATWERLEELLSLLESSAEASSADSRSLEASLKDARSSLTELSSKLSESETRADELSSSLERCAKSLELSEASLKQARALASRNELDLRLWRGAAVVGLALGIGGLAGGILVAAR
jgi:septal ring factor EnvC (AmiA/AmiB activator)